MEVKPFKAFRFDSQVVGEVGSCISPPYDVISGSVQQKLYEKSDYNIVRIIKGKSTCSGKDSRNQYTRASDYFKSWTEEGILKQDPTDSIYAYLQDFRLAGIGFQRRSFIALAELEEFGKTVKPHEYTFDEPKIDRLNLRKTTSADFGLVFMLYEDPQRLVDTIIENTVCQKPLIDFLDEQEVRHRLFAITAEEDIDAIIEMMNDKSCIIADGHHRYESALHYLRETSNPAARYQMTAFVNTCQEGLIILATHRVVANLADFSLEQLIAGLGEDFKVTAYPFDAGVGKARAKQKMLAQMKARHPSHKNIFGIYGGGNSFYVAVLKNKQAMDSVNPNMSKIWRELDVSVLHKLILEKLLGISDECLASGRYVEYIKDTGEAVDNSIAKVDMGQSQAAFFMNPVTLEQLKKVTEAGEKMPPKSTYFYPKMYSGLVINKL